MVTTLETVNSSLVLKVYTKSSPNAKWVLESTIALNLPTETVLKYDLLVPKHSKNIIIPTIIKNVEEDLLEVHVFAVIKSGSSYELRSTGTTSMIEFDNMTYDEVPEDLEFGLVEIPEQ